MQESGSPSSDVTRLPDMADIIFCAAVMSPPEPSASPLASGDGDMMNCSDSNLS